MTLEFDEPFTCALCHSESAHPVLMSVSMFESTDLDMRPGEMMRSSLHVEVQRCPSCGFCHHSIADEVDGSRKMVESASYRDVLTDDSRPELARRFHCHTLIDEQAGQWAGATWATIRAAWACDDVDDQTGADQARQEALSIMDGAAAHDQRFAEDSFAEVALRVDLLRRLGRFDDARDTIDQSEEPHDGGPVADVLRFQLELIARRDTAAHKVDEATDG